MPRPRFMKLPLERREQMLEAAAMEFAAHGFAGASLNRILERARLSKGAAYYYFDDKTDLFLTLVGHYVGMVLPTDMQDVNTLTGGTFWAAVTELYRRPLVSCFERPWVFGTLRAAGELWRQALTDGPLAAHVEMVLSFARALLSKGQELGEVRTDVPFDLLFAWTQALDDANDRWLLDHWAELDRQQMEQAADRLVDALRRLLTPATGAPGPTGGER